MERSRYLSWMHGVGALFAFAAILVGGYLNPAIGFPIVVAILIALEIPQPGRIDEKLIPIIYGSIKRGGVKRGVFINELFTVAVIVLSIRSFFMGNLFAGYSNVLLTTGLIFSDIASEIFLLQMRKVINPQKYVDVHTCF